MAGGSLANKTAEEASAAIMTLAVRKESPMVSRAALFAMHQDRDEPVRTFAARAWVRPGLASSLRIVRSVAQLWISLTP